MGSDEAQAAWLTVLTAEHYSQDARTAVATAEASSRASLYMLSVSSTLVALGFAGIGSETFLPLACVAVPILSVVGLFTEVRLVGTSLTNIAAQRRVVQIRRLYTGVNEDAARFFATTDSISAALNVSDGWRASLSTMATMIAVVNSAVVAVGVACVALQANAPTELATVVGAASGLAHLTVFLVHQQHRFVRLGSPDSA